MYRLRRVIFPVGFGAFCLEQFDINGKIFNVVYDCGSKTRSANDVKKMIADANIEHVDILFISHFHEDHINCIQYLPIDKNTIVVMPLMNIDYIKVYEQIADINIEQLKNEISERTQKIVYIQISNPEDEGERNEENSIDLSEIDFGTGEYTLPSGTILTHSGIGRNVCPWVYVPFHLLDKALYNKIIEELHKKGCSKDTLEHFDGKDKELNSTIREIYKKLATNNLNESSMLVASYPFRYNGHHCHFRLRYFERNKYDLYSDCYCDCYCDRFCYDIGCSCVGAMYTGDMPLATKTYYDKYETIYRNRFKHKISLLQIPHHGSHTGYNKGLYNDDIKIVFSNSVYTPSKKQPVLMKDAVYDAIVGKKIFLNVTENDRELKLYYRLFF